MLTTRNTAAWRTPTGYALSHCQRCKYGWTRTGTEGGVLTVCMLDHCEPVLADMKSCDRFALPQPPEE
jgi:hypothetical protein